MFIVFTKDGHDITKGKVYEAIGTGSGAHVIDDRGDKNYSHSIIGELKSDWVEVVPAKSAPVLRDIQGHEVKAGDIIAYAFVGAQSRHLAMFEVQQINGPTALCRASDGAVVTLGVFEQRAIVIK
jgi:hypothetical protein